MNPHRPAEKPAPAIKAAWLRDGTPPLSTPPLSTPHRLPRRSLRGADRALATLWRAARSRTFWLLAGGFAICGMSTNGLIQIHLIPAAHDHGMPGPMAAGLLAMIGVFDVIGTVLSGWLTDRLPVHVLLGAYYALRGVSLLILPFLLSATVHPSLLFFILFYGLDWVATVPPTIALCRRHFGTAGPVVFGWVFAAHQLGAALAATAAGSIRDTMGSYTLAFTGAGLLCFLAAAMSIAITPASSLAGSLAAGLPTAGPLGAGPPGAGQGGAGGNGSPAAGTTEGQQPVRRIPERPGQGAAG